MPSPNHTFSEFIDVLLVRLYELDRERGPQFFDLLQIAGEIKESVPSAWVVDAANVLRTMALADIINNSALLGAQISGQGRIYVEQGRGVTSRVRQAPANYYNFNTNVTGNHNQVAVASSATQAMGTAEDRTLVSRVLSEMKLSLKKDASLRLEDQAEANDYIDLVGREMRKSEPNRTVLAAVLDTLSHIASIASAVNTVIKLLNLI